MKRRGLTLLELLISVMLIGLAVAGATRAYVAGIQFQERVLPEREARQERLRFEDRLITLIESAFVESGAQDTYFVIGLAGANQGSQTNSEGNDSLTFTTHGDRISGVQFTSEDDFETRNEQFGPQGGLSEVSISLTPVGEAGDQEGLFYRIQRPSDGDPSQGGYEEIFWDQIETISFEAFDGVQWTTIWDTTTQQTPRLPAAIRISYTMVGEAEDESHQLIVRLPLSDVTPTNPLEEGA